jgi:uncharacterized 2Fe-2S/4Fe-4S cluster protein (DUF4445 family)
MAVMTVAVQPRAGHSLLWAFPPGVLVRSDCGGTGRCGKCRVTVIDADGRKEVLACQYFPDHPVTVEVRPWDPLRGRRSPELQKLRSWLKEMERPRPEVGRAVDFGTTTIAVAVVDTAKHRVLYRYDYLNPQLGLGSDVMTRITNLERLQGLDFTGNLREHRSQVSRRRAAVVTANTVMAHFLWDRDPSGLGSYPYRSELELGRPIAGYNRRLRQRVWMPPLLGSFVGSDCTSAIVAAGLTRTRQLSLLVDAGTNGEVVLGNRERLLVASTAAGPAFEGATLECGGLAEPGSIVRVRVGDDGYLVETLRRATPGSICGSGVLSATRAALNSAELLSNGKIVSSDRITFFTNPTPALYQLESVYLSQADIRQVQVAKAAIAAAIRLLLEAWPARAEDISRIHLTGRFGASVDPVDAVRIGLLPDVPAARIRRHPDLALLGATRALYRPEMREAMTAVPAVCTELDLSTHPRFEEVFVQAMELAPWC